jgi:transcriptional regulator with XRE-family HTH domain
MPLGCGNIVLTAIFSGADVTIGQPQASQDLWKSLAGPPKVADLTQEELLKRLIEFGLKAPNRATISSLENGHKEPRLGMLFKMGRALGVRPSEILREVEEKILPPSERQRMDRSTDAKPELLAAPLKPNVGRRRHG